MPKSSFQAHKVRMPGKSRGSAIRGIVFMIMFALIIVGMLVGALYAWASTPIQYLYPDDTCALEVEFTERGRVGHDCGTFDGVLDQIYIDPKTDLRTLHDGIR